jgi:hypothetical protein
MGIASLTPARVVPVSHRKGSMRVGVEVACGVDVMLAIAKLRAVEMHDAAITAAMRGEAFDPHTDEVECVFQDFSVFESGKVYLCGSTHDLTPSDVEDAKRAVGRFAKEVNVLSSRPAPLATVEALTVEEVEDLADTIGAVLPQDWDTSVRLLVRKHQPLAVTPVVAMEEDGTHAASARKRCTCGNFASQADLCNTCHRWSMSKRARMQYEAST